MSQCLNAQIDNTSGSLQGVPGNSLGGTTFKQETCPHCGACQHCGRGGSKAYPWYNSQPYWQNPNWLSSYHLQNQQFGSGTAPAGTGFVQY